ncbi:PepSY-like domain-containing protein [Corallococcus caeni]|uniref:Putative beta-lactamase-inhibitor-like PepSY-like domain-containing protein n=1 Tax=Corallococcus caeni TaxID=3082388 RepID=A0ABQ6QMY3_9BACT|nr:hypothetical protein ASNO1_16410 [Corallococcus sp. NO1]
MKTWKAVAVGTLSVLGLAGPAMAKDTELTPAEVPAAVKAAVASKYPKAKAQRFTKETEKGKTVYEVILDSGAAQREVSLAEDGSVLSEEQKLAPEALPATVQRGLASSPFASARIKRAEKETKAGVVRYEVVVEQKGKTSEVVFDEQGKLLKSHEHEEDGPEDADDGAQGARKDHDQDL